MWRAAQRQAPPSSSVADVAGASVPVDDSAGRGRRGAASRSARGAARSLHHVEADAPSSPDDEDYAPPSHGSRQHGGVASRGPSLKSQRQRLAAGRMKQWWTHDEDEIIENAIRAEPYGGKPNWNEIALRIGGRTGV